MLKKKIYRNSFFSFAANVRHREFYARPNRLQKTIWPPNEFEAATPRRSMARDSVTPSSSTAVNNENNFDSDCCKSMTDSDYSIGSQSGAIVGGGGGDLVQPLQLKSINTLPAHRLANNIAREQFYNGIQEQQKQQQQLLQQQRSMETEEYTFFFLVF